MRAVSKGQWCVLYVLAGFLLVAHFVLWTATDYDRVQSLRRYGEEMAVATSTYLERVAPTHIPPVTLASAEGYAFELQTWLLQEDERLGLRPWQFWRTLPTTPPGRPGPVLPRANDDTGRARLTEMGFRLLGGVAPFLLLWLALFLCLPVLAWLLGELALAGHAVVGLIFVLLLGCSPFVVESLALPYSGFGFYLVALLAIAAFASYAVLRPLSAGGLLRRAAVVGGLLAVCALCRSGVLLLWPGLLLASVWGAARLAESRARRFAVGVLAVLLAVLPYALVRPAGHHELWTGVWQGLGDYDRSKGHVWDDSVALRLLQDAGFDRDVPGDRLLYDRDMTAADLFFRDLVWRDVRADPVWYLGILARRVVAVVSQDQLFVLSGRVPPPENAPRVKVPRNQGNIRYYYHRTTTADWLGLGRWRVAIPLPVFWLGTAAFVVRGAWVRTPAARRPLVLALCLVASVLTMPVLLTTASALETQAFVVVYFLCFAFLADAAVARARTEKS